MLKDDLKWVLYGSMLGVVTLLVLFFTWGFTYVSSDSIQDDTVATSEGVPVPQLEEVKTDSEAEFMRNLHYMTHQKVSASEKWGSLEITSELIDEMLETLDDSDFENESFYREALTEWKNGNFNNSVEVHNKIWSMQGGTIGKAIRLLDEIEEDQFIKRNFK